ncbi:MAG: CRISPR-associated endonuclease Cas2 [Bacteroidaceae bacterium]|nr:CRISPR-associated endonuclease Cas2 [Bacteroidaceae bacterium]
MPRRKKELSFKEQMLRLANAGISNDVMVSSRNCGWDDLDSLEQRTQRILNIVNNKRKITDMLFFVLYDIESNKVRNQVSKYLIKNGCFRIQRSVFLAELSHEKYNQIKSDLTEVQACYENKDSILIVPVSTELINAMKIIGKSINIDVITRSKNTLFF